MSQKNQSYDVIVIGSGPGGYVCAIRAAQLGFKVACIEKDKTPGGTCLNVGCIPSKALLQASEKYDEARHHMKAMGVDIAGVKLNLPTMMKHKDDVVASNTNGIGYLFKKNKIDHINGKASLAGDGKVKVGGTTYNAKHIVIATGSDVMTLPGITIDEKQIVSSTGALTLKKVPKTMAVIGGGYIGLEMGAVWSRLGAQVTIIEYLDRILPGMDGEISKEMQKILKKKGLAFKTGTKVSGAKTGKSGVSLTLEPAKGGESEIMKADIVLVAVGRKPYTDGLGLDKAGVDLDDRGRIKTDAHFKTTAEGIYAIGDVIAGPMLAHKAEDEGAVLAEILAGQSGHIDYNCIPGVVYTWPEAAQVGKTEEQLKEEGIPYNVGKFPFAANGRARAMNATDGFVKILAHKTTDRLLGMHIIGPEAGTMIAEGALVMEFGGSAEDIARTCHAHPTLEEAVREAAMAAYDKPIHI